ncbi:hypothetical protein ACFWIQ_11550 [Kitasatospora sp. NPDC127059]|uniref:hypothetical protein n=1 Tax=unclassified Kitasatospora TaxID=2633591 RepID=UPI00364E8AA4
MAPGGPGTIDPRRPRRGGNQAARLPALLGSRSSGLINEAYRRVLDGDVRFRFVIDASTI